MAESSQLQQSNPLVSIIMPAYNAEKYIADAIKSVLAQTYHNWELIVIDDLSSDSTREIVQSFLVDSRIQLVPLKQNMGVDFVRNAATELLNGDYVAFLDADDLYTEASISERISFLQQNPSYRGVYGGALIMNAEGKLLSRNTISHGRLFAEATIENALSGLYPTSLQGLLLERESTLYSFFRLRITLEQIWNLFIECFLILRKKLWLYRPFPISTE